MDKKPRDATRSSQVTAGLDRRPDIPPYSVRSTHHFFQTATVAMQTFREARRQHLFWPLIVLAVGLFLAAPLLPSDETAEGRVRLLLTVCLHVTMLLATVLAIVLAARTVSRELETRTVYCLATKPIAPATQIAGKFLGVLLTLAAVLALLGIATWTTLRLVVRHEARVGTVRAAGQPHPAALESTRTAAERKRLLERELFVARIAVAPTMIKPGAGGEPAARLTRGQSFWAEFVVPTATREDADLAVRLRAHCGLKSTFPVDLTLVNSASGEQITRSGAIVRSVEATTIYFPARLAEPGGRVRVILTNAHQDEPVRIERAQALVLALPAHGLAWSLVKGFGLLLAQLALVAAATVLAATVVSFPVAVMVGAFVSFTGHLSGFVGGILTAETHRPGEALEAAESAGAAASETGLLALRALLHVLPDFDSYSPLEYLVGATYLPGELLAQAFAFLVGVRGLLCVAGACWLYGRRELAA